ncbi:phosphate signaling complex protein PhoU [Kaarinaea lacus]
MGQRHNVLDKEEAQIKSKLQSLLEATQKALETAMVALQNSDTNLANEVIQQDVQTNKLHNAIESECLTTIATQQPVATDLRILIASMHIASELERIADHAVGIAETTKKTSDHSGCYNMESITKMADQCRNMLDRTMAAYFDHNPQLAEQIAADDADIDKMQSTITSELLTQMIENNSMVALGTYLLWIVHSLERIGDRITNICEQVIFIEKGISLDLN